MPLIEINCVALGQRFQYRCGCRLKRIKDPNPVGSLPRGSLWVAILELCERSPHCPFLSVEQQRRCGYLCPGSMVHIDPLVDALEGFH